MPGEACVLPQALLGQEYGVPIGALECGSSAKFTALSPMPPGLKFYGAGNVDGAPTMATADGTPFEFEVEAQNALGAVTFQNFLLQVKPADP